MRVSTFLKKPSTWLASGLFVPSAAAAIFAVIHVAEIQRSGDLLQESIFSGDHNFIIESGGKCAGEIRSSLSDGEGFLDYGADGELRTVTGGRELLLKLHSEAAFNAIGQLTAALFTIKSEGEAPFEAGLGLSERDPIKVRAWYRTEDRNIKHELAIPGPAELVRVNKGEYRLKYAPLAQQAGRLNLPKDDHVARLTGFKVNPETVSGQCAGMGHGFLDIEKIGQSLLNAFKFMGPLLEKAGISPEAFK